MQAGVVNGVTIQKVLPHLLDKKGRHTLFPSLLERDAYQAKLRSEPDLQGGLRFDIRVGRIPEGVGLVIHLETHGTGKESQPSYIQFQRAISDKDRFHRWFNITLSPEEYAKLGKLISWRVTLRQGETVVAEQRSFLW